MKTFLPPLSPKEESEYLRKMDQGDSEARYILIERNLRLVAHVCKKYQSAETDMEDLISIGTIGLMKAVATFNRSMGNRLGTYAARCIDNELLMHFRARKKVSREVSLYEPIGTDKEGNQIHLLDVVVSEDSDIAAEVELKRNTGKLYECLPRVLTKREQAIICMRYGLYNRRPVTQREIAQKLGISRSYVSRIEKKAIGKLRQELDCLA